MKKEMYFFFTRRSYVFVKHWSPGENKFQNDSHNVALVIFIKFCLKITSIADIYVCLQDRPKLDAIEKFFFFFFLIFTPEISYNVDFHSGDIL